MKKLLLALFLVFTFTVYAAIEVQDDGVKQGYVNKVNFAEGVDVTASGILATAVADTGFLSSLYVELTGSNTPMTGPLDMGDNPIVDINYLDFNLINGVASAEGRMVWNDTEGGVNVGMKGGNVNLQVGQEVLFRAVNKTGSQIDNGTPVYISGSQGNLLTIAPADADFDLGVGFRTIGVVTEDIGDNLRGYVTIFGRVRDIDTRAWAAGSPLYLAVGGGFTNVPPSAPDVSFFIGLVEKVGELDGEILITMTSIPNLNSLSDVDPTNLANEVLIKYDLANNKWIIADPTGTGDIGYWDRTGTTVTPSNSTDTVNAETFTSLDDKTHVFGTTVGEQFFLKFKRTGTNQDLNLSTPKYTPFTDINDSLYIYTVASGGDTLQNNQKIWQIGRGGFDEDDPAFVSLAFIQQDGNLEIAGLFGVDDNKQLLWGSGSDVWGIWDTNSGADDLMCWIINNVTSSETAAIFMTNGLNANPNGDTSMNDYKSFTHVYASQEGADSGDYSAVEIGGSTTLDVTVPWHFDFYARVGADDNAPSAVNIEVPPYFRFGSTKTALNHFTGPGDVGFNENVEIQGELRSGSASSYLVNEADGDTYWVGAGSGLPYGSMYNHDTPTTVTILATNTATQVPSGFLQGQVNLATFQNAREIVILKAGVYKIDWSISFSAASANQEIEGVVMINNALNIQASAHRRISTATDTGAMSGVCILSLAANDIISLGVINETSTANVIIEHSNMTVDMKGG